MKQYQLILIGLAFFGASTSSIAQKDNYQQAELQFKGANYTDAIELYQKAKSEVKDKKKKADIVFKLAESYRMLPDYKKALTQYESAIKSDPNNQIALLHLADMYRINGRYDDAIKTYEKYQKLNPSDPLAKVGIESSKNPAQFEGKKTKHTITNFAVLNSAGDDFAVAFADKDHNTITFTSNRTGGVSDKEDAGTGKSFSDIYTSSHKNGKWSKPTIFNGISTNDKYNDGALAYNKDFTQAVFTRCGFSSAKADKKTGKTDIPCEIFYTELNGDKWSEPVKIDLGTSSTVGQPAFSTDGKTIYFSSDMKGGKGGKDIWFTTLEGGKWSAPMNAEGLNTVGDETFPFVAQDGMIYFSSNGRPGLGGWDMFSAKRSGSLFKDVQNLGQPWNSAGDDFAMHFEGASTKMKKGFFSSNREGSKRDDIYYFELPDVNLNVVTYVKEKVSKEPIAGATVTLTDDKGKTMDAITDKDGKVTFKLAENTAYKLEGKMEGYEAKEGKNQATVSTVGQEESKDYNNLLLLIPVKEPKPIKLPKILYELNSAKLTPMAIDSLQGLLQTLNENPEIVIQLESHTDARGSNKANEKLSQARSQSVVDWLISQKVHPARLKAKGWGETKLLNGCKDGVKCTEEEHEINRRTEFSVLSYDFDPNTPLPAPTPEPKKK